MRAFPSPSFFELHALCLYTTVETLPQNDHRLLKTPARDGAKGLESSLYYGPCERSTAELCESPSPAPVAPAPAPSVPEPAVAEVGVLYFDDVACSPMDGMRALFLRDFVGAPDCFTRLGSTPILSGTSWPQVDKFDGKVWGVRQRPVKLELEPVAYERERTVERAGACGNNAWVTVGNIHEELAHVPKIDVPILESSANLM